MAMDRPIDPVENLRNKQARNARWAQIGGGLVAAVFIVRALAVLIPHSPALKTCDAPEVQDTVRSLLAGLVAKDHLKVTVDKVSNAVTASHTDKAAECAANVTFSDHSTARVTYALDPKTLRIRGLKPIAAAADAPPGV